MIYAQVRDYLDAEWSAGPHHGGGGHQPADADRECYRQVRQIIIQRFSKDIVPRTCAVLWIRIRMN